MIAMFEFEPWPDEWESYLSPRWLPGGCRSLVVTDINNPRKYDTFEVVIIPREEYWRMVG